MFDHLRLRLRMLCTQEVLGIRYTYTAAVENLGVNRKYLLRASTCILYCDLVQFCVVALY